MSARLDGVVVRRGSQLWQVFDPPPWAPWRWLGFLLRRVRVVVAPAWPPVSVRRVRSARFDVVAGVPAVRRRVLAEPVPPRARKSTFGRKLPRP